MNKLIIVVIVLLLILIIGFGFFMFYALHPTGSASADSLASDKVIGYNTGSQFITSLRNSRRFIKTDIIIEVQNKEDEKILTDYNYRVRDCILDILGNIDEEEIQREDFKDELKAEIKAALEDMLKINSIKGIYFNDFVVQ